MLQNCTTQSKRTVCTGSLAFLMGGEGVLPVSLELLSSSKCWLLSSLSSSECPLASRSSGQTCEPSSSVTWNDKLVTCETPRHSPGACVAALTRSEGSSVCHVCLPAPFPEAMRYISDSCVDSLEDCCEGGELNKSEGSGRPGGVAPPNKEARVLSAYRAVLMDDSRGEDESSSQALRCVREFAARKLISLAHSKA